MKLQSPTLILVLIAMALGSFVAVTELRPSGSSDDENSQVLFQFEEDGVRALVVETSRQRVEFEKEADTDDGSEWQMRSPEDTPADDAAVVFLVNLMASGVSDRVFEVEPSNLNDFGFDQPLADIEVTLDNDDTHRLILGNYDFNGNHIYAQTFSSTQAEFPDAEAVAPSNGEETATNTSNLGDDQGDQESAPVSETPPTVDVLIVSTSFDAAVNRSLTEWKQSEETDGDAAEAEAGDAEAGDAEAAEAETSDAETSDAETSDAEAAEAETSDAETSDNVRTVQ